MRTLTPYSRASANYPSSTLWKEWESLFDAEEGNFAPAAEIAEHKNHYSLSLDLPGLKKEDIHIELANNVLTVSGERKHEERTDDKKVQRVERSYGSFQRSFTLPTSIHADKIEAHYDNGVLNLALPKSQIAQTRKIEIHSKPLVDTNKKANH
jgi:HSP20 family protein